MTRHHRVVSIGISIGGKRSVLADLEHLFTHSYIIDMRDDITHSTHFYRYCGWLYHYNLYPRSPRHVNVYCHPQLLITPLKTNMSSENQCLEDVFPTESSSLFRGRIPSFSGVYIFVFWRFVSRERTGAKVEAKIQRCWAPQGYGARHRFMTLDIQNPPNTWWIGVKGTLKSRTSGDVKGGSNIYSPGIWMSRVILFFLIGDQCPIANPCMVSLPICTIKFNHWLPFMW